MEKPALKINDIMGIKMHLCWPVNFESSACLPWAAQDFFDEALTKPGQ